MALKITRSTLLDTLKDVVPFQRHPNRAERNNKIDTSADTITCPNRSSNLHPVSRKLIRGLSRLARAKKAIKMWTPREKKVVGKVEADLAYAASKPLPESPARGSVCSSNTYSPKEIGIAAAVPVMRVGPCPAPTTHYKRNRANATVSYNGSPIPRKPVGSPAASPGLRASLEPTIRTSRDAHRVIMGGNTAFPPRNSSLTPMSPTSGSVQPREATVVSRLSRPTASSSARAANTPPTMGVTRSPYNGPPYSGARAANAALISNGTGTQFTSAPRASRPANGIPAARLRNFPPETSGASSSSIPRASPAARSVSDTRVNPNARPVHATRATPPARYSSGTRVTPPARYPSAPRATPAVRSASAPQTTPALTSASGSRYTGTTGPTITAKPVHVSSANRPANLAKAAGATRSSQPSGVARAASIRKPANAKAPPPTRSVPRTGTMNSLKTASKGFKSRISAMITNRRRPTGIYQHGSKQELSPLIAKDNPAESAVETADEKHDKKQGTKLEEKFDEKIDQRLDEKLDNKLDENLHKKLDKKPDEKPDENSDKKPAVTVPASLPSAQPQTAEEVQVDEFLAMSRDQFDRLLMATQRMQDHGQNQAAVDVISAYGAAILAIATARQESIKLAAAVVALSRRATELGSQALEAVQG